MINSMTGFGRGQARHETFTATVELRSVNSRFCEVSVRMPRSLNAYESDLQARLKKAFSRGRFNVQIQVEEAADDALPVRFDARSVRAYTRLLDTLRTTAGIEAPVTLDQLLKFSDAFLTADEHPEAHARAWQAVQAALEQAIDGMKTMRRQEGAALEADLAARIDLIEARLNDVDAVAPGRIAQARTRLHERLADLLGDERVNPERLEFEIALLADRLDVTEECVRLRSHLQLFREALANPEPVGRKLNFLAQEINREVNTIGSKANDAAVAHLVVQMKEELEKIREQVENTE